MSKEYPSVDVAKLLMALFVVAIHTNLLDGALFPTIRLSVPVFFIFTGFFSFSKINAAPESKKTKVLWRIVKRYLQLYLFWFIAWLPFTIYLRNYHQYDWPKLITAFVRDFVWRSTFQASWYLMACVLGIAIVYLLSKTNIFASSALGIILYCLATVTSKYQFLIEQHTVWSSLYTSLFRITGKPYNNVCIAVIYILLGKWIAEQKHTHLNIAYSLGGFAVCYLGLLCEFYSAANRSWFLRGCDCWFMLAPTALFFVLIVLSLEIKIPRASTLRSISTIIYCSHPALVLIVSRFVMMSEISDTNNVVVFSVTVACTIVLSFLNFRLEKWKSLDCLKYSH